MLKSSLAVLALVCASSSLAIAQPPREPGPGGPGRGPGNSERPSDPTETLTRILALDKNNDGSLTSDEFSESRWKPMIEGADANGDKTITKEELTKYLATRNQSRGGAGGQERSGRGGPGGFGGPGFGGPGQGGEPGRGGLGGPGGRGAMRPGVILPDFLIEQLRATSEQREALAKLQATVDAELAKILTAEQQERIKQMAQGPRGEGRRPDDESRRTEGEGRRPEGEGRRPEGESRPQRPNE